MSEFDDPKFEQGLTSGGGGDGDKTKNSIVSGNEEVEHGVEILQTDSNRDSLNSEDFEKVDADQLTQIDTHKLTDDQKEESIGKEKEALDDKFDEHDLLASGTNLEFTPLIKDDSTNLSTFLTKEEDTILPSSKQFEEEQYEKLTDKKEDDSSEEFIQLESTISERETAHNLLEDIIPPSEFTTFPGEQEPPILQPFPVGLSPTPGDLAHTDLEPSSSPRDLSPSPREQSPQRDILSSKESDYLEHETDFAREPSPQKESLTELSSSNEPFITQSDFISREFVQQIETMPQVKEEEPTHTPKESTPLKEPTPPPRTPTPPPREPTPPPRTPTPPPREPTPPPREPTPPPREPTPPPREPTPPLKKEIEPIVEVEEKYVSQEASTSLFSDEPKTKQITEKPKYKSSEFASPDISTFALFKPIVNLIYWRDVKKSGIVFGTVMVILLSLAYLSLISVVAYTSLLLLTGTIAFRIYKNIMQAVQKSTDGHPFKEYLELDTTLQPEKVHEATDLIISQVNSTVSELKRLFLVEDLIDSVKFGCLLWCLTYVGSWFNGLTIVILSVVALFTLPKVYEQNQAVIDQYIGMVYSQVNDIMTKVKAAIPIGNKENKEKAQ